MNQPAKKTVKLQRVSVLNYKGISELKNDAINGNHFIVYGKNGQGKTSLSELINRSALRIDPKKMADLPIKIGAKSANVGMVYEVLENGTKKEILVETTFRPSGTITKLIDLSNEGELKPFQEKLRGIIGDTVDISPLINLDGKKQISFLKEIGFGIDVSEFETSAKEAYDERKVLNKQIAKKKAQLIYQDAFKLIANDAYVLLEKPTEPKEEDYKATLNKFEDAKKQHDQISNQIADLEDRVKMLLSQIETLKNVQFGIQLPSDEQIVEAKNNYENYFTEIKPAYEQQLQQYNQQQETINAYSEYQRKKMEIEDLEKLSEDQTNKINSAKKSISAAIANVNINEVVAELSVKFQLAEEKGDETIDEQIGVFYKDEHGNELPFNIRQISYGKSLVALMKLQSHLNAGKLNLFHIPSWNELDQDSQDAILEFAEQHPEYNIQLCIEEVKNTLLGIRIIEKN